MSIVIEIASEPDLEAKTTPQGVIIAGEFTSGAGLSVAGHIGSHPEAKAYNAGRQPPQLLPQA